MPLPRPFIPGCDLAGTVEAVGPGVTNYKPGDRVWGSNQGLLGRQGTFAEYVCTGEEWLYPTPPGVPDTAAAAAALVGITAHVGLFRCAALQKGETQVGDPDDFGMISLLLSAVDRGITLFDTSPWYGHGLSEHRFGTALRRVPRDSYVLSTKVGRWFDPRRCSKSTSCGGSSRRR